MTELIWDGKYVDGKNVPPRRIVLPFQTVETVNESAAQRQHTLNLFSQGKPTEWRNRLIWGDKSYVLPSLLPEFAGKVNLIYIDPPFDTGANFSSLATIPDAPAGKPTPPQAATLPEREGEEPGDDDPSSPLRFGEGGEERAGRGPLSFVKEPSVIEQKAYRDTWGKGLDSYLKWFYETVVLLRELLTDDGSIYVHLDHHVSPYAKVVLDEVFGAENFKNEIVWKRTFNSGSSKGLSRKFPSNTDTVYFLSGCQYPAACCVTLFV